MLSGFLWENLRLALPAFTLHKSNLARVTQHGGMQGTVSGSAVGDQDVNSVSVGRNVLAGGDYLTSKLHFLAALNQFLDDQEVGEAFLTKHFCGACLIEIGVLLSQPLLRLILTVSLATTIHYGKV